MGKLRVVVLEPICHLLVLSLTVKNYKKLESPVFARRSSFFCISKNQVNSAQFFFRLSLFEIPSSVRAKSLMQLICKISSCVGGYIALTLNLKAIDFSESVDDFTACKFIS